ncbi:MAG: hypothetical protein KGI79_00105 [Patescibacteria group bacterium]|nr:hypothetical protein [Patescibacteria group bacterium]MDE2116273.1 hypothetical protein [Patescibacteria group bacterium]
MKNKTIVVWSVILAVLFATLAIYYWVTPAGNLLSFMPGYQAGSAHVHLKHGIASIILALGLAALAWFKSGPKSDVQPPAAPMI